MLGFWTLTFTAFEKKWVYLFYYFINFVFQVITKLLPKILSLAMHSRRVLHFLLGTMKPF